MRFYVKSIGVFVSLILVIYFTGLSSLYALDCSELFKKSALTNLGILAKEFSPFKRFEQFSKQEKVKKFVVSNYTPNEQSLSDTYFPTIEVDLVPYPHLDSIIDYLNSFSANSTRYSSLLSTLKRLSIKHEFLISDIDVFIVAVLMSFDSPSSDISTDAVLKHILRFIKKERKEHYSLYDDVIKFIDHFPSSKDDFIEVVTNMCIDHFSKVSSIKVPAIITSEKSATIVLPRFFQLSSIKQIKYQGNILHTNSQSIKRAGLYNIINLISSHNFTVSDNYLDHIESSSLSAPKDIDLNSILSLDIIPQTESQILNFLYPPVKSVVAIKLKREPLSKRGIASLTDIYETIVNRVSPHGDIARHLRKLYRQSPFYQESILEAEDPYYTPLDCYPSDWQQVMEIFQRILQTDPMNVKSMKDKTTREDWIKWIKNNNVPRSIQLDVFTIQEFLRLKRQKINVASIIKTLCWMYYIDPEFESEITSCTATVVSSNTIITAAHCLKNVDSHTFVTVNINGRTIKSEAIYAHPFFFDKIDDLFAIDGFSEHDIGIVRFPEDTFSDIPPSEISFDPFEDPNTGIDIGTEGEDHIRKIGFLSSEDLDSILSRRHIDVNTSSNATDVENKKLAVAAATFGSKIYTVTNESGLVLTQGDSGGPLFNTNNKIIGINSKTSPDLETVHASIEYNKEFLEELLLKDPLLKIKGLTF